MQTLTIGDIAPDFSLQNQHDQTIQLTELLKTQQVLLYFYPKAMTPGCTVQACALRDHHSEFEAKGVAVVGISTDQVKSLAKFALRDQLNFTLLADPEHQVAEAFGVWGEKKFMGKVYDGIHRTSFLIGTDGLIKQVYQSFKTSNHHEVVLKSLP
ncbi:MAG: thioredoxin-dependent thiol peroxidase [Gammaproteobacteria bacterium]|nr:thioredoxin-dependent thiol peroxidase [Gammaproteobacteria bacterium]MBU2225316.1 thioredoxin-dependent thiol peroxidase [Gammaproteobacteria bacterium]MBU2278213.1 thioredoxin-dependent thiol peroxidase [Gammaproteobacteria bacterium]MBU2427612.1 thioredoxin-dependent thiol peroxidase [Gammaproteobacteria bacterium]